jgi:hypothetical protein
MAAEVKIDSQGFNKMIKALSAMHGKNSKKIVRAVSADVLTGSVRKTKAAKVKDITEGINKEFRRPFKVKGAGSVGLTKSGKLWVNLKSWNDKKKWALVGTNGKLVMNNQLLTRTGKYKPGSKVDLGAKQKSEIRSMINFAKNYMAKENKYRKALRGLGKAAWIETMRKLRMKTPSGPKYALAVKLPHSAKSKISARQVKEANNFFIEISNGVQSCLNPKAKGINAFRLSLNGQVSNFKTRMNMDSKKYARDFATKHGFTVK